MSAPGSDLLIDECLSPILATAARKRGYQATHVTWTGMGGRGDHAIGEFAQAKNFTLVTKNSIHFRGLATNRGETGVYAGIPLHAGLVCLNGPVGMDLRTQAELFEIALDDLVLDADLTNMALEITLESEADAEVTVHRYPIPTEGQYALDVSGTQKRASRKSADR